MDSKPHCPAPCSSLRRSASSQSFLSRWLTPDFPTGGSRSSPSSFSVASGISSRALAICASPGGRLSNPTVSRMTIATVSDDETFEQIKKQLNRMIEVIKVIDFTDVFVRMKEILYIKVFNCSREDKAELFQIAETFKAKVIDYGKDSLLLEFVQTATKNDAVVKLIKEEFHRIEVVHGGNVGIESISMMER